MGIQIIFFLHLIRVMSGNLFEKIVEVIEINPVILGVKVSW